MVKLQHDVKKDRYFLCLNKDLVLKRGWKKGQKLLLLFNERGNIEIME